MARMPAWPRALRLVKLVVDYVANIYASRDG